MNAKPQLEQAPRPEPLLSLPNLLTLVRLPLAVAAWLVVAWPTALLAVMAAAAVSDWLDGWFARRIRAARAARGAATGGLAEAGGRGAWLDPLCDKTFVVSTLGAVAWAHQPPWHWLALIAAREFVLVPLTLLYHLVPGTRARLRVDFRAGWPGKLATVAQFAALLAVVFGAAVAGPLCWVAGAVGTAAAGHYVIRALKHE